MVEWLEGEMTVEYRPLHNRTSIPTDDGHVLAEAGDYLIRDPDGHIWPVDGRTFDSLVRCLD